MKEKEIDTMMMVMSRDIQISSLENKLEDKTALAKHWRAKYMAIPRWIRNIVEYLNKIKWIQGTNR